MPDENANQTADTTTTNTATTQTETSPDKSTGAGGSAEAPIMNTAQLLERLERARKTVLSELGYDDEKAAKAALDEAKKLKEAQMSEAEKATKALADAEKKATDAQAEIAELKHAAKVARFESAVRKVATDAKAKYPDDVYLKVSLEPEFKKWLEADDPDEKAIVKWVDTLKTQRPEWFTNGNGTPGSPSNRNASGNPTTQQEQDARQKFASQIRRGL